jgi:endonuclease YncB( thermonuclease family)
VALLGIAAFVLFEVSDIPVLPRWRGAERAAQAAFTLCGKPHRRNCVVDGDTIRYRGEVIRIAGIDAPEIHGYRCGSERDLGRRAADRLLQLINAGPFDIVRYGRDNDKYGRKLRAIERDGRSLGDMLVAEGLARRWDGARRSWCH